MKLARVYLDDSDDLVGVRHIPHVENLHGTTLRLRSPRRLLVWEALVKNTDQFTGAHVRELVNSAIISAIDQKSYDENGIVTLEVAHFQENLSRVKAKKMEPGAGFKAKSGVDEDLEDLLDDEY